MAVSLEKKPIPHKDVIQPLEQQNAPADWPQSRFTSILLVGVVIVTAVYIVFEVVAGLMKVGKL